MKVGDKDKRQVLKDKDTGKILYVTPKDKKIVEYDKSKVDLEEVTEKEVIDNET